MPIPGFQDSKLPDGLRELDDTHTTRKLIYDGVLSSLSKRFPMEDDKHRLELTDLRYDGPQDFSWADQKRAMLTDRSVRTPVKGKWSLYDKVTGAKLDEKQEVVMHVPYYTDRGTIVNNGGDYAILNQSRLKPGVYARTKKSGEHEAQFNIRPGTGKGFRLWLEPSTGIFRVNVGQANIPAYQFLKTLGVEDQTMSDAWGTDLLAKNINKTDSKALDKLFTKFTPQSLHDDELALADKPKTLKDVVAKMEVDPWVIERTLGTPGVTNVTPDLILKASKKLLNINRGDEHDDDRDAPEFSNVHSIEDLIAERIDKDAGRTARQLMFKIRRKGDLSGAARGILNPYMVSLIQNSGLAQNMSETNPLDVLSLQHKQTKFGEGGLGDTQALTDEARDVNPGQVGFTDLISTSESTKVGAETQLAYRTFKGNDKQIYGEFVDNRSGKTVYLKPEDIVGHTLAFPGQRNAKTQYVMKAGKMVTVASKDVDYSIPSQAHMYSPNINMTPMLTGFMPGRAMLSSKYWTQFLPVVDGEAPLVKNQVPGTDRSFNEYYGRKSACLNARVPGVVTKITDMGITITDDKGNKTVVETVQNFPLNRITALSYKAAVKEGDVVKPGDLIATSNFTNARGEFSMGRNLKTCVVPARGKSYEDAYAISETAAQKLSTEKLFGYDVDQLRGVKVSKNNYMSAFPSTYGNDQLDKLDADGMVKPGMTVNKGDPLILATGPRLLSAADAKLGNLHKVLRNTFKDNSVVWEYDQPGIVADVALTARGAKVNVKSQGPVQIGDKLTTSFSSKGVVGQILADEEMPRDPDTNEPYELMFNPMTVLSRVAPNQIMEMNLAKIAKATGKPYVLPDEAPEEGWNEFTRRELEKNKLKEAKDIYDPMTGKTIKNIGEGYMYISPFHHLAEKKLCVTLDTEFETLDGWILGQDLKPWHKFKTVDPHTGKQDWQFATAINFYNMSGQTMYHIEDDHQDLRVTAQHRTVVHDELPMRIELAENLNHQCRRGLL